MAGPGGNRVTAQSLLPHPAAFASIAGLCTALALGGYGLTPEGLFAAAVAAVLVAVSLTDAEYRIIPNRVVVPAIPAVLVAHAAISPARSLEFLGATLGAGAFLLLPALVGKSAMGMGDVKLAALLGAALGRSVIAALLIAFVTTLPVAAALLFRDGGAARKATIPFGPFLAFGGLVILILPRLLGIGG